MKALAGMVWWKAVSNTATIGVSGITYRFIVVADRQACCAQGLEFVLADDEAVYPEPGTQVEICGMLESYQEDDQTYVRVVADELRVL